MLNIYEKLEKASFPQIWSVPAPRRLGVTPDKQCAPTLVQAPIMLSQLQETWIFAPQMQLLNNFMNPSTNVTIATIWGCGSDDNGKSLVCHLLADQG